jgi:dTDP-4-dehydrorhamnose 3,5-epimerase
MFYSAVIRRERMPFVFTRCLELPDIVVIEPPLFKDERGWFSETYRRTEFAGHGIDRPFVQDNHSLSTRRGVLRGLHFQSEPFAQDKLVRCVAGAILDIAVDIRRGSPTFAKWVKVEISAENRRVVWIPVGFAHGTLTLTDRAELIYKTTAEYSPLHERAILWSDPQIGIQWPIREPIVSAKDASAPLLADVENDFTWSASGVSDLSP